MDFGTASVSINHNFHLNYNSKKNPVKKRKKKKFFVPKHDTLSTSLPPIIMAQREHKGKTNQKLLGARTYITNMVTVA